MDSAQFARKDPAAPCLECSVEAIQSNLQHFKDLCKQGLYKSQNDEAEVTSDLIRRLQRAVVRQCEELCQAREELHNAQHQVSSLQDDIQSLEASIDCERRDQLQRIRVAKSRLLEIYNSCATMTPSDGSITQETENTELNSLSYPDRSDSVIRFVNLSFPLSTASPVGPVVQSRVTDGATGPVQSYHPQSNGLSEASFQEEKPDINSIKILDVKSDGKCVQLRNTSKNKDYNLANCRLQQEISKHPVAVFRFSPGTEIKSLERITVWADGSLPPIALRPTYFIFKGLQKWGTGPHVSTLFYGSDGRILDKWTAAYRHHKLTPFTMPNNHTKNCSGTNRRQSHSASFCITSSQSKADAQELRLNGGCSKGQRQTSEASDQNGNISKCRRPFSAGTPSS